MKNKGKRKKRNGVRNGNPAKQGLKHLLRQGNLSKMARPKRKSSKTRIETVKLFTPYLPVWKVRNGNPAKQGLKLVFITITTMSQIGSETEIQQNKD